MSVEQWARDLNREVFEKWKSTLPDDKQGFKVFSSPVHENPEILLAGTNPGSKKDADLPREHMEQFHNGNFSLPSQHEFLVNDWGIATAFREGLFGGNNTYLKETVATNRLFLHRGEEDDVNETELEEFNNFCEEKFLEIVERLSPELVLCFAQDTYDCLEQKYEFNKLKSEPRAHPTVSTKNLLWVSDNESPQVMWIAHPSSSHFHGIEDTEWETIREEVYPRVNL